MNIRQALGMLDETGRTSADLRIVEASNVVSGRIDAELVLWAPWTRLMLLGLRIWRKKVSVEVRYDLPVLNELSCEGPKLLGPLLGCWVHNDAVRDKQEHLFVENSRLRREKKILTKIVQNTTPTITSVKSTNSL